MKIIKLRRGSLTHMPALNEAELVYASDTNELYIGASDGNTTLSFNGGALTDTTKGRLIPRHGLSHELQEVAPGELIFLDDKKSLIIGLENNQALELNQEILFRIDQLEKNKRDNSIAITGIDIAENEILLQHLSPAIREALTGVENPIEVILTANSIATQMLKDNSITTTKIQDRSITYDKLAQQVVEYIEQNRQIFDFGGFK